MPVYEGTVPALFMEVMKAKSAVFLSSDTNIMIITRSSHVFINEVRIGEAFILIHIYIYIY